MYDRYGLDINQGWYFDTDSGSLYYITGISETTDAIGREGHIHHFFPAATRKFHRITDIKKYISEARADLNWAEQYQSQLEASA